MELTAEQLQAMITGAVEAAVKAAKAPSEIEQKQLDAAAKKVAEEQEYRRQTSADVQRGIQEKHAFQHVCSHEHRNGDTHMVYIQDGHYMLCQLCQAKVRPGVAPAGYNGYDIFDTALFNRSMQKVPSNAEIFG